MTDSNGHLRGLIFDMGDIFFDATAWRRWLTDQLHARGVAITYQRLVEIWESYLVDVYRGNAKYWPRLEEMLLGLGLCEQAVEELVSAARDMGKQVRRERKLFPGVASTLASLKRQGLKLAVLSDTESGQAAIRQLLADLGIERHFDAVVTSLDIAAVKPEPQAFQAAADALGLDLAHCGFVGHDVDELVGARSAGLYTIAYNYAPHAPADRHVGSFEELLDLVKSEEEVR